MSILVNLEASNKEDWIIQFSAKTDDTNEDIVWTGAVINFKMKDNEGSTLLEASTASGTITIVDPLVVQISIAESLMNAVDAGSYPIGCVYQLNSITAQAFVGTASIYEGVALL